MTANTKNTSSPSDDIDLLLLVERSLRFLKRYKWVFLVAILLGIGSGFYLYYKITRTYESRMVIHSYFLTNQELIQITGNWNALLRKKEHAALAETFHCSENLVKKIKSLKAKEIQQVFTSSNPNGFTIDATVTDNAVLDSLKTGIVYAFEHIDYVKERLDAKKASLRELLGKTETEIKKLDSTKKILENIISGKERGPGSLIIDGSSINRQLIEMNEKLLSFKESLAFTSAVQVLQGFSKFSRPADPNLFPLLVIGLVFFLAIGYVLALIHSINQQLKARSTLQDAS